MIERYGLPDEITPTRAIWHGMKRFDEEGYTEGFRFEVPKGGTGDPDETTIDDGGEGEGGSRARMT